MKKEKIITRTIILSECEFMCVNVETANVEVVSPKLTGKLSKDEALKIYKANYETDTFKVVNCQSVKYIEHLYGMSEKEFLKHAVILPPRKLNSETNSTDE